MSGRSANGRTRQLRSVARARRRTGYTGNGCGRPRPGVRTAHVVRAAAVQGAGAPAGPPASRSSTAAGKAACACARNSCARCHEAAASTSADPSVSAQPQCHLAIPTPDITARSAGAPTYVASASTAGATSAVGLLFGLHPGYVLSPDDRVIIAATRQDLAELLDGGRHATLAGRARTPGELLRGS
ncbi:hypothetical protein PV721_15295 [Streptomyces sp. MB09-01]|uniref:hypothetical protein n=1 Tax=Streptomyces sp. MB09-01 TaxID=3028666 RepID=UPI0029A1D68F|nr:hypothetical protein [Streptomyces sp. MB09-01]MDX3535701.1 hypothetical protein [Streptomyces sp. MB09-01]